MAVYVIAQGRVEDRQKMDEYVSKVIPTIGAHSGRVVAFDEAPEVVEGSNEYPRTVVLEFADQASVDTSNPAICGHRKPGHFGVPRRG